MTRSNQGRGGRGRGRYSGRGRSASKSTNNNNNKNDVSKMQFQVGTARQASEFVNIKKYLVVRERVLYLQPLIGQVVL